MQTLASRTLARLTQEGWLAAIVEKWNDHARRRHDLFGLFDVIAVRPGETLAVQCTSYSNISSRIRKIENSPVLASVREAGWRVEVWGWRKRGKKRGGRWECRRVEIS